MFCRCHCEADDDGESVLVRDGKNNEADNDDESVLVFAGRNDKAEDDNNDEYVMVKIMKVWDVLV